MLFRSEHCKEIEKLTLRALAFRQRISRNCGELCGFLNMGITQSGNMKNKNTSVERKAFTDKGRILNEECRFERRDLALSF